MQLALYIWDIKGSISSTLWLVRDGSFDGGLRKAWI